MFIILVSSILLVGYASCKDGRWVGIVTHDQEDMVGATAVAETLLGFFYFGCKSLRSWPLLKETNDRLLVFHDRHCDDRRREVS